MIHFDHERLKNSCHLFIGVPFKDYDGAILGEIVRTRIDYDTLFVTVRTNEEGKRRKEVDEFETAAIQIVAPEPIIEDEAGPQNEE